MTKPRNARRRTPGPTVADVARRAGVSSMTVSRVINRDARVLPDTRARVEAAVAQLGYVPNAAARSLAGAQHCRLALLYANPSSAYLSEFLLGSLHAARSGDAELIVEQFSEGETAQALADRLAAHRIDGVIMPPPLCDRPDLLRLLHDAGQAVVQVATGEPAAFAHAVSIDDEAAAHAMTAHLLALGHRRIGFIAGDSAQSASALRRRGYERALAEAGLALNPDFVAPGDFTYRSGLAAAERLLDLPRRPSAIFASNDDMAAAAIGAAHRRGLDVPRDLTVCGFDDTASATTIWPELTTIHQPIAAMAERATALLIETVSGRMPRETPAIRHERLDFALIRRATDASAQGMA